MVSEVSNPASCTARSTKPPPAAIDPEARHFVPREGPHGPSDKYSIRHPRLVKREQML